jgi:hypothetical protein
MRCAYHQDSILEEALRFNASWIREHVDLTKSVFYAILTAGRAMKETSRWVQPPREPGDLVRVGCEQPTEDHS